jgi:hypothetical protein
MRPTHHSNAAPTRTALPPPRPLFPSLRGGAAWVTRTPDPIITKFTVRAGKTQACHSVSRHPWAPLSTYPVTAQTRCSSPASRSLANVLWMDGAPESDLLPTHTSRVSNSGKRGDENGIGMTAMGGKRAYAGYRVHLAKQFVIRAVHDLSPASRSARRGWMRCRCGL